MSARQWQPGDVAMVTYRLGLCRETNLCAKTEKGWDCLAPGVGFLMHRDVIEARPLVVIDPEDRDQVARLRDGIGLGVSASFVADALRSLVTPPKPEEPTGDGALIVCDYEGKVGRAVLLGGSWTFYGEHLRDHSAAYDDFADVRILSQGVTE